MGILLWVRSEHLHRGKCFFQNWGSTSHLRFHSRGNLFICWGQKYVDGANLTIYKLCNKKGWYYDSKNHQCQLCHEPCLDCLYRSNSCVSCHLGYYLIALNHSCLQCSSVIANCESCQSASNCTQCMKGYALLGDSCQLCSDYLEGCSICQSVSKCSQC